MTETVGFDVNVGGNFGASLSQMIAQSDAYARSADTMLGKVALLNVGVTALITRTSALTGANKVATAEAAAYQERLANVAATAKVTGQSFQALEKTALSLGRSTGNISQAVATVESLGTAGVTTTKSIDSMAKAWTNLGAANNTSGIALGQTMLNLGRTFGNSESQLTSFGDSLTSTSKKYGASADAAAGYAKALAPVAASVGMTEGSVIGLGVAASRLGEEGYASANAFNKVLLDMGRSIRNGTPEIKEYAGALGMTQQSLAKLFKEDPTEVLLRFTESIGKGGPQAMRTLESLGLDATRTVRSITALSSQGNLRQIMAESTRSYGSGASADAAEKAMDTVNHHMQQLGETMSQTVAAAGKPFLGFLDTVVQLSNAAASGVNALVSAPLPQWLQKIVAVGGFAAGGAMSLVQGLGLLGVGAAGFRAVRGAQRRFGASAELERSGAAGPRADDLASTLGARWAGFMPEPLLGPPGAGGGSWRDRGRMFGRAGLNWASIGLTSAARAMDPITGQTTPYSTPGEAFKAGGRAIWGRDGGPGLQGVNSVDEFGKRLSASAVNLATWGKEVTTSEKSVGKFGTALATLARSTAGGVGGVVGGGVSTVGKGINALGLTPAMLAIPAGMAAYSMVQNYRQGQQNLNEQVAGGLKDANAAFNEFAAAAGLASRGLVALGEVTKKTTNDIARTNESITKSFTLSEEQLAQAKRPDYERAFTAGTTDPNQVARLLFAMLGTTPTATELSRAGMDVANEMPGAPAQQALKQYGVLAQSANPYSDLIQGSVDAQRWYGGGFGGSGTDTSAKIETGITSALAQAVKERTDVYGASVTGAATVSEASKVYAGGLGKEPRAMASTAKMLADVLGGDEDFYRAHLEAGSTFEEMAEAQRAGKGTGLRWNQKRGGTGTWGADTAAVIAGGGTLENPDYMGMSVTPQLVTAAKEADMATSSFTRSVSTLGDQLTEAEQKARSLGTTVEKLTPEQIAGLSPVGRAMYEAYTNTSPQTIGQAGVEISSATQKQTGSIPGASLAILQQLAANGGIPAGPARDVLEGAFSQVQFAKPMEQSTQGLWTRTQAAIQVGQAARSMGTLSDEGDETKRRQLITDYAGALQQRQDFMKQYVVAEHNMQIQLNRQAEEANVTRLRSERDFGRQMLQATEDYQRQRGIAVRDFNLQMTRAAEDAAKSLYDPYQRVQAQMVWDTTSLMGNIAEQNEAIQKQTNQVRQLRRMGLSQQAVDTLSLSDPKNAQQVSRLVEEAVSNPAALKQMNALINQRIGASKAATQNENNVDFRRATESFRNSMHDSAVSFETAMKRARQAHSTALDDMREDLKRSSKHAHEDLAEMAESTMRDYTDLTNTFLTKIAALPKQIGHPLSHNLNLVIAAAVTDSKDFMDVQLAPWGLTSADVAAALRATPGYERSDASRSQTSGSQSGASLGAGPSMTVTSIPQTLPHTYHQAIGEGASQDAHADRNWSGLCDRFVAVAYGLAHSGYNSAKDHWNLIPGRYKTGGKNAPPGALYFWGNGQYGHTALSIGNGMVYSTDFVHRGQVDVTSEDSITRSWGDYRGWSYPYFGGKTARVGLAAGGIATQPMNVTIAEAGHSEAVIPLNRGGANVLAEAMVRYVDSDKVHGARMQHYGTQVITYSYDHSTKVQGPITVMSQDPDDMARQLAAKARQDRLAQPVGR